MLQPYSQSTDFWRERDFGQKITATFEFLGVHWRPLGRVLLYLVVPVALLRGILGAVIQSRMFGSLSGISTGARTPAQQQQVLSMLQSPIYYVNLFLSVAFVTLLFLSIYGYVALCLQSEGDNIQPITPSAVWVMIRGRLVGAFFSFWGLALLIGFGFLVFFVPGLYLSVALSLFFIVSVVENTGFGATISRCLSLTKGKWWSTFGIVFIMPLIIYIIFIGIVIVSGLLGAGLRGVFSLAGDAPVIFTIVVSVFSTLLTLLFYPPILLAIAFQYFNLVERQEGVGMRHLVGQLGQAAPLAGPTATTYRPDEEGEY